MARMSRAKSVKQKKVREAVEESGSTAAEEEPSGFSGKYGSAILWCVGWAIAALSGYVLGESGNDSSNPMWRNNLLSEYVPPGRLHTSLFQSRNASLSLGESKNAPGMANLWDPLPESSWEPCAKPNASRSHYYDEERDRLEHPVRRCPLPSCQPEVPVIDLALIALVSCQTVPADGNGYLQVCNAVAAANMLNAILLIPYFRKSIVWEDPSQFHDIYDIDHFMSYLKEDLSVVRSLPEEFEWSTPELYEQCEAHSNCLPFPPKHATKDWYMINVLPILRRHGVAALERYNHKLSFEDLPAGIVDIRCRTNFYALRFVHPIVALSETLVTRLKMKAKLLDKTPLLPILGVPHQELKNSSQHWWDLGMGGLWRRRLFTAEVSQEVPTEGKFLGLHVRFEKDMVAHSACYYNGGRAEQKSLAAYRRVVFKNGVPKSLMDPSYLRKNGSCLLTPEEMGLLLAGLGFKNNTVVYTASKSVYGGKARLQPLRDLFPLMEDKESLASHQELEQFLPYAHKLAAVDFLVLLSTTLFMSNAAGNFPNVLTGHRTFFGPRKSIHPDKAFLAQLFQNTSLAWADFSNQAIAAHKTRLGAVVPRKRKYSVYRYPAPDCMCQKTHDSVNERSNRREGAKGGHWNGCPWGHC